MTMAMVIESMTAAATKMTMAAKIVWNILNFPVAKGIGTLAYIKGCTNSEKN